MHLTQISYKNYRNIASARFVPSPEVTHIGGMNGQGKTNLLEGIYLFASGRSFRTNHDAELIREGERFAELALEMESDIYGKASMIIRWDKETRKRFCRRNGVPMTLMSEMIGTFRAVLFCPQHLSLVCDGPGARRSFIDVALSQSEGAYLSALRRYNNILAQRNALLKTCRDKRTPEKFLETAEIWSEQLATEAEFIAARRDAYIKKLSEHVGIFINDMTAGKETASLTYKSPRDKAGYMKLLTENTEAELRAGCTLYGVHKDDIAITLSDRDARAYASRGQQRSIALAMKLAEGEISKEKTGEYPVFLFDDVLSELDSMRREYLLAGTKDRQVIMTSCESGGGLASLTLFVQNGEIFDEMPQTAE